MNQTVQTLQQSPYQQFQTPSPPFLSEKEIEVLKRTLLQGFTEDEQESFIRQCQRTLLDPFSKQIYATRRYVKDRRGDKVPTLVPVTSVIGLTAIAARTGDYDGCVIHWAGQDGVWQEEWLREEFPLAARCIVYHKRRTHPEIGIARWAGYAGQAYNKTTNRWEVSDFWERLPDFMLGKCARAQALRGAFPDQCSNLYITEELQGNISEADQLNDEQKIAENRRREEELLKNPPKGARLVETKPAAKPTPAEAAEPAFPEDVEPISEPTKPVTQVPPPPVAAATEPDDLDMGQEPTPPGAFADALPAGAPVPAPWRDHVIMGLKNDKFFKRKVGDLSPTELAAIEAQWLPKVRRVWDEVNSAQKADAMAFESAIAFYKMEKPWT